MLRGLRHLVGDVEEHEQEEQGDEGDEGAEEPDTGRGENDDVAEWPGEPG